MAIALWSCLPPRCFAAAALLMAVLPVHAHVITTVDSAGNVGTYNSLQLNGGNPVVSYYDFFNGDLKLATCTAGCTGATPTWVITRVDTAGDVGAASSLQLNAGSPVISYRDRTNAVLKLATCTGGCATAAPTWVTTTVDSTGDVGAWASLALNGGNPVVSYYDATNGDLKLATCTAGCATATPTWVITVVDAVLDTGQHSSLQLNAGNPVVSYYDATNGYLRLATCTAGCATATPTWVITTIDRSSVVGTYNSLKLNGGNPVVSYYDGINRTLKVATCTARCATATPTWVITTVDTGSVGFMTSLQLSGGNPVVSYLDAANRTLKLAVCTARCGTTPTWLVKTLDSTIDTGQWSSLQMNGADPMVSYFDAANGDLKLALVVPAAVTAVAVPAAGIYAAGATLTFVVTFSDPVWVNTAGGAPTLPLTIGATGRAAAYFSGSGTAALTFRYTVAAVDADADGISVGAALALNGATIRYANDAVLALNGVGSTAGVLVLTAYSVTASAGPNGAIAPAGIQSVSHGSTAAFTVTPNVGYTASMGGTCGGSLVGTTYTTSAVTGPCTVVAAFTQTSYPVTASAGANGSIAPSGTQSVLHGSTASFTVTPGVGFTASVGGTCGGALVGTTYTTSPVTAACAVVASFASTAVATYTGPSATGTGSITASFTGGGPTCTFSAPQFIPLTGHPRSPPAGPPIAFPHGLFDFTATGCTPGATISMTITYPAALAAGTQYWKYGPTPGNATPHWYVLPATIAGNTATFTITDGALGDDDLSANGTIVDQGGPGVPVVAVAAPVPTLSEWAMALLGALLLLGGLRRGSFAKGAK